MWQTKKFVYTEQFLLIRRNAYLLKELQSKAKAGEMVVLDTDDYLDPTFSREAHRRGINMDFMVLYVGGTEYADTNSINETNPEDYGNLLSSRDDLFEGSDLL